MMEERSGLIVSGPIVHIVADGIAAVEVVDADLRLYLFRWREISGVIRKSLIATVQRPIHTFSPEQLIYLGHGSGLPSTVSMMGMH